MSVVYSSIQIRKGIEEVQLFFNLPYSVIIKLGTLSAEFIA